MEIRHLDKGNVMSYISKESTEQGVRSERSCPEPGYPATRSDEIYTK